MAGGSSGALAGCRGGHELPAAEGLGGGGGRWAGACHSSKLLRVDFSRWCGGQPQHLCSGTSPSRGPYDKAWPLLHPPPRSGETHSRGHKGCVGLWVCFFFFPS